MYRSTICLLALLVFGFMPSILSAESPDVLPGTTLLELEQPLDEVMVAGIDRFALKAIEEARQERINNWPVDFTSQETFYQTVAPLREEFKQIIGVVDERVPNPKFELISTLDSPSLVAQGADFEIHRVRWSVLEGVTGEGLLLLPTGGAKGNAVALPDADWTPEQLCGLLPGVPEQGRFPLFLAQAGYRVLVPTLVNREQTWSGHEDVFFTNQPHREWIYRQAFILGRHIIGYEVQKVLAGLDALEQLGTTEQSVIAGIGEGGLLALYSGAIDERIDTTICAGYFDQRESVWKEPIYRNVWGLLTKFGDAQLAGMIAPRELIVVNTASPEVAGPPEAIKGHHSTAAPGRIESPGTSVQAELKLAGTYFQQLNVPDQLMVWEKAAANSIQPEVIAAVANIDPQKNSSSNTNLKILQTPKDDELNQRQQKQVAELTNFTQGLLDECHKVREQLWSSADHSSPEAWTKSTAKLKEQMETGFIGKIDLPLSAPNVRTRKIMENEHFTGYEVVFDVFPEVIAGGILLVPHHIPEGEERPLVVCQHGLEGLAMDCVTYEEDRFRYYKAFASELAKQGFITYSPQNPYRGKDQFRTLQLKSNLLKRSLFSYIIPQHRQTLRWLGKLPYVDANRMAFYGLSYGGKTAMRVPPFVDEYCLSICSGDFDEWIVKIACNSERYCYVFHGEYEIFEWNMGNLANYAELATLIFPRPFMVERGHNDGVAPDRWVAAEYAKVRRHYNQMGLNAQTTIEYFDGPHQINLVGTTEFLKAQLGFEGE
ncbi:Alpha/beta hydrolase family protein [Polystyrenella longa]|uniref:Alpha/beta hydrolase family protein n=1 Tax=Polystyrenella longa TaxID=2528007 RepID=A0A518CJ03_9PLAN|nr:hypothetical protein [Polystyrenella longa]QDU79201.1 Alpha/beta hydrolase family protein [Polystyrenella longa]